MKKLLETILWTSFLFLLILSIKYYPILLFILIFGLIWGVDYTQKHNESTNKHNSYTTSDTPVESRIIYVDVPNLMYISREDKQKYLQSEEWQVLKQERLILSNYKCELCNSTKNLQLHHVTYERLTDEVIEDVRILCSKCHQRQHNHYGYDRKTTYLPLV